MEEVNFVLLWKEQYEKIEQSLVINQRLLKETISRKAARSMRSLIPLKIVGMIAAILFLILLGYVLYVAIAHYHPAANYFIVSMAAIFGINARALYDYGKHLVWIMDIDYDGSVTAVQQKLTRLQLSIIRHGRIMVWQIPFWTTFHLSNKWFPQHVEMGYIVFQIVFTGSAVYLAWWLYKNLSLANAHTKWGKALLGGSGEKALQFYKELEDFKLAD